MQQLNIHTVYNVSSYTIQHAYTPNSAHQSATISGVRCPVSASPCPVGRPHCLICAQPATTAAHPGRGSRTRAASTTPHKIESTKGTYFQYFIKNYILIGRYRDRRYLYLYYSIKQVGRREAGDIYEFIWHYSKFAIDAIK